MILVEENPIMSIPFILVGLIFVAMISMGFLDISVFYAGTNSSGSEIVGKMYTDIENIGKNEVYAYLFFFLGGIHVMLFIRALYNIVKEQRRELSKPMPPIHMR